MPVQESNTGQYHPGCGEFSEIQDMQERALGDKHPFALNVLNQLAEYHWEKGDRELALQYYQSAARKLKQISPPQYPYLSVSLCGIGHYYHDKADYINALEYYLCALLPENSPLELKYFYDLDALSQISSIYLKQGKRFEAMVFCNKELALISASSGMIILPMPVRWSTWEIFSWGWANPKGHEKSEQSPETEKSSSWR
jgi:tetratricopeptide (TPR) repeat protein